MKLSLLVIFFEATAKVVNVERTEAKSREVFASDLNPDYAQLSSAFSDGHSAQLNYFFKNERNILTFIIAPFRKIGRSGNCKVKDFRIVEASEIRGFSLNREVSEIGVRSRIGRRSHKIFCSDLGLVRKTKKFCPNRHPDADNIFSNVFT